MPGSIPLILTPTPRLARHRARRAATDHVASGQTTWRRPDILWWSAWLERLRADWFLNADDSRTPITADPAREIWKAVIDTDIFIGEPRVADMAARAWTLIHDYRLDDPADWPSLMCSEDSARFRAWVAAYRAECERRGVVDESAWAAEVPGLVADGAIPVPGRIELAGFDLPLTPLQGEILAAFAGAGAEVVGWPEAGGSGEADLDLVRRHGGADLREFVEGNEELRGAALWARGKLEDNPGLNLAVVVPDLAGRVSAADNAFRRVFDPAGFVLKESGSEAWHISLGRPLAEWPLVADALFVLGLSEFRFDQAQVRQLLRSPFIGDPATERARAAAADALGNWHPWVIVFRELAGQLNRAGLSELADALGAWRKRRREAPARAWPSEWTEYLQKELSALAFGKGRPLDSREFQTLQRWQDTLEDLGALDAVLEAPIPRADALRLLAERAQSTIFRERNPGVPVEILGLNEALGSRFDAIWIAGMDNDAWPPPARREPLIPGSVQAAVPQATQDGALALAKRHLALLLDSAPEVVASYATGGGEEQRSLTPLLEGEPYPGELEAPMPAVNLETIPDDRHAPELSVSKSGGGTRLLNDQSACPFRAFAVHRLGALETPAPRLGLDPATRGSLVHAALDNVWRDLPDQAALLALSDDDRAACIEAAVTTVIEGLIDEHPGALTEAGRALETERLRSLLGAWLELEGRRAPFRVTAREEKVTLNLNGLEIRGRIDRRDELADGGTILIDYKTGASGGPNQWYPEARLGDVQMPAYALVPDPPPVALAFGRVRADGVAFDGLAEVDVGLPGVQVVGQIKGRTRLKELESWRQVMDGWKTYLEALAGAFRRGDAEVDPRDNQTCTYCHLHAFCRIFERAAFAEDGHREAADE